MTAAPGVDGGTHRLGTILLAAALVVAAVVVLQAAATPFWGDDYRFLYEARQAVADGQPWWGALVDPPQDRFWRPLGEEMVWRFVAGPLGGQAAPAHAMLLVLWAAGALAMGAAARIAVDIQRPGRAATHAFAMGALAYAAHGAHGLTLAWAAAANSLLANLFTAVAVAGWLLAWSRPGRGGAAAAFAASAFVLGLLCREITIVAPALAMLLGWPMLRAAGPSRRAAARDLGIAMVLAAAWGMLREGQVVAPDERYAMALGGNVLANGAALAAFGLNVPRDALRFWIEHREPLALAWAGACATLQLLACVGFWMALPRDERAGWALRLPAVAVVGAAPYFLLAEPGYPYYLGVSLLAVAVLAAAGHSGRAAQLGLVAALGAGALANGIEQRLPQPGLYARAAWAEASLDHIARLHREHPAHFASGVVVVAEDPRDFYAIGPWGLAVATGRPRHEVGVRYACSAEVDIVRLGRATPPRLDQCPRGLPFVEWPR